MPDSPRHPSRPHNLAHGPRHAAAGKPPAHVPPPPNAPPGAPSAAHAQVNLDRCRLSLIKGEHRWRFRWEPGSEAALISAVADLARNPRMNFDWFDAAVVCRHIAQGLPGRAARLAAAGDPAAPPPSSPDSPNEK